MESEPLSFPEVHAADAVRHAKMIVEEESPERALLLLEDLQRRFPREAELWRLGGRLHEAVENVDGAIGMYRRVLDLDPGDEECLLDIAELLLLENRFSDAQSLLEAVPAGSRHSARATALHGVLLAGLGRIRESERALRCALQLDPDYAWATRCLCDLLQDDGRLEDAHRLVLGLLDRDPLDPYNHAYLADLLLELGRPTEAEASFRTALWLWPGYTWAARRLAQALCQSQRAEEAIDVLQSCLEECPDDPWTLSCLGCLQMRAGDPCAAEHCFRNALEIEPELDEARDGLVQLLLRCRRVSEARELLAARPCGPAAADS